MIIDERRQNNFGDENFGEETLVEQMEGERVKIEDTNLIRYCNFLSHFWFVFFFYRNRLDVDFFTQRVSRGRRFPGLVVISIRNN